MPRALLPELQRYKDSVRCAKLGAEVPRHRQHQLTRTLIVCLLKTHFLHRSLIVKSQLDIIESLTRPGQPNQAPQAPARQRKSSHKFLRPLSPHRKGSRSSKGSKKGEASGSLMVVTAANSSRQSINSSASCQAADPDQVSVASETSSSFHDSLAS